MANKGEYRVGMDFNPGENPEVTQIKGVVATLIDNLEFLRNGDDEIERLISIAQTKFEEGCMFAVKAVAFRGKPPIDVNPPLED